MALDPDFPDSSGSDVAAYHIHDTIKLRQTRPFVVREHGDIVPKKSIFNYYPDFIVKKSDQEIFIA